MKTIILSALILAVAAPVFAAEGSSSWHILTNQGMTIHDARRSYSDLGYDFGVTLRPDAQPWEASFGYGSFEHKDNLTSKNAAIIPQRTSKYDITYFRLSFAYLHRVEQLGGYIKLGTGAGLYRSENTLTKHSPDGRDVMVRRCDDIASPFFQLGVGKELWKSAELVASTEYNLGSGKYGFSGYSLNGFSVLAQLNFKLF